jgi:diguanylate cyclase (GGDEF)-like protein
MRTNRELAPFAATAIVAWVAVLFGTTINWGQYIGSVVLLVAAGAFGLIAARRGFIRVGTVVGSIIALAALGLVRNASGGSTSGVSTLSLLAVFETALTLRSRRDLTIVLVALAAFYLIPILAVGPPHYPHSGYRGALIAVVVSSIIGLATQQLVADIRRRAAEARRRERMLVQVGEIARRLFDSLSPRQDICEAVRDVSGATLAIIYEPVAGSNTLHCSASTRDLEAVALGSPGTESSAMYDAFLSGQPVMITSRQDSRVGNIELWTASGKPTSLLYEPLLRGEERLGVLVAGWPEPVEHSDSRAQMTSLLAHEVAAVIQRADMVDTLTDEAYTDQLTTLPNRRAWDARLSLAMDSGTPFAVVMLDIDMFKRFNDTYGHPGGDRLLREAAAGWQVVMRSGDFLARLGGEEFGLLIFEADRLSTQVLVERVRAQMPDEQTCSAGIAFRLPGESADSLITRADQALYDAKSGGRDRAEFSDGPPTAPAATASTA